jgi:cobalamin biosynthesis protein CobT
MSSGSNRKESPAEPFKRALASTVRAIAGDSVIWRFLIRRGGPRMAGKAVQLPEPSRVPTARGDRGGCAGGPTAWRLRLRAMTKRFIKPACAAGRAGRAQRVRSRRAGARWKHYGCNAHAGDGAANIAAKVEDHYSHGRFMDVTAQRVRGATRRGAVADRARDGSRGRRRRRSSRRHWSTSGGQWVEERAGDAFDRMGELADDQSEVWPNVVQDLLRHARPDGRSLVGGPTARTIATPRPRTRTTAAIESRGIGRSNRRPGTRQRRADGAGRGRRLRGRDRPSSDSGRLRNGGGGRGPRGFGRAVAAQPVSTR